LIAAASTNAGPVADLFAGRGSNVPDSDLHYVPF